MDKSTRLGAGRPVGLAVIILSIIIGASTLWANPMRMRWQLINSSAPATLQS